MTKLFLSAMDVWLFRDGKPFSAGDDHRAVSMFPPSPSVVQGAIRSHHLVESNVNLFDPEAIKKLVGTTDDYRNLRIRGPFLARNTNGKIERLFPAPANARTVDKENLSIEMASPPGLLPKNVISSLGDHYSIGFDDPPKKGLGNLWLSEEQLKLFFAGQTVSGTEAKELFLREGQPGIGVDHLSHTTLEGQLFEVEYIRPRANIGLCLEISGYQWADWQGTLRFGGEGRAAIFHEIRDVNWEDTPEKIPKRFILYFATPAFFADGWAPQDWSQFFKGELILRGAALPRFQAAGGFDYSNSKNPHKPSRRFVPAGSVYYFESNGDIQLQGEAMGGLALSEFGREIGYGQIIIPEEGW